MTAESNILAANSNASNLGVMATSGNTLRSLANRAKDFLNIKDFGAVCDGITDDAPVIQSMINNMTGDIIIRFPAGKIFLGSTISSNGNKNIYLIGSGMTTTLLQWSAGTSVGFNHGQGTSGNGSFTIKDMTLIPTTTGTGTAVRVSLKSPAGIPTAQSFSAENVILGATGTGPKWNFSFDLYGCQNCIVINVCCFQMAGQAYPGNTAFRYSAIEGTTGIAGVTTQITFDGFSMQDGDIGIGVYGSTQGVNLVNCNLTGPRYGIKWVASQGDEAGALQVTNCQFNNAVRGIYMENANSPIISNNLFIQFDNMEFGNNWCCIELNNSHYPLITNNYILNPGGTVLSNVAAIYVHSNIIAGQTPGRIANNVLETQNIHPVELKGTIIGTAVENNEFWNVGPQFPSSGIVVQTAAPVWASNTIYPAYSAITNSNMTWTTVTGGTSGNSGGPTLLNNTDGNITWQYSGVSLATYPNSCRNSVYGNTNFREDGSGNLIVGQGTTQVNVNGSITTSYGIRVGSYSTTLNTDGLVDMLSRFTTGNTYDVRQFVIGGISGTNGAGDYFLKSPQGSATFECLKMGFFSVPSIVRPTVTGSRNGNSALASLLTALNGLGLIIDSSTS